uniref:C2H2-type domain-containing protein n=1 Tax=Trichuris muris TaxID=70415 RepID=A0A5S6Q8E4_TRIMR
MVRSGQKDLGPIGMVRPKSVTCCHMKLYSGGHPDRPYMVRRIDLGESICRTMISPFQMVSTRSGCCARRRGEVAQADVCGRVASPDPHWAPSPGEGFRCRQIEKSDDCRDCDFNSMCRIACHVVCSDERWETCHAMHLSIERKQQGHLRGSSNLCTEQFCASEISKLTSSCCNAMCRVSFLVYAQRLFGDHYECYPHCLRFVPANSFTVASSSLTLTAKVKTAGKPLLIRVYLPNTTGLIVTMNSSAKKKCRQYSVEYLSYGFNPAPQNPSMPFCLNCMKMFSNESMRPSKMKKHLDIAHPDKKDNSQEYYQNLRNNFERRVTLPRIVTERSKKLDKG